MLKLATSVDNELAEIALVHNVIDYLYYYSIGRYQNQYNPWLSLLLQYRSMEERSLELKGEIEQIYSVLVKEEHDKMPFQGIEIAKTLNKIPFFTQHFDTSSEQFINLCITQDAKQYQPHTDLYKHEAQEGLERYVYVILQGEVVISEQATSKRLGIFRVFGQVQILFGLADRFEKAVVTKQAKLMRLKESSLLRIFTKRQDINKCLHYLNANQYFNSLGPLERMHLSLCMIKRSYEKGEIIKNEGELLDKVMFFIYGRVQVTTKLNIHQKESHYIIDNLEQMSTFGEFENVRKVISEIRLKGAVAGAYYWMKYRDLQREQHRILQVIKCRAVGYPSSQQLIFFQEIKSTVHKQEQKIMKNYWR